MAIDRVRLETGIPDSFEAAYEGTPAWDIGQPQPALAALFEAGAVRGRVLDVGCGTGEHALALAARGEEVWGVDLAGAAITRAVAKARERGLAGAIFRVADALHLEALGVTFDAVIDSGLFHVLADDARERYARSVAAVLAPRGRYIALVFSEQEPAHWGGPRRVSHDDFHRTFARDDGWCVEAIDAARFHTTVELHVRRGGAFAWLARISRA